MAIYVFLELLYANNNDFPKYSVDILKHHDP